jgi:hypothetical protein
MAKGVTQCKNEHVIFIYLFILWYPLGISVIFLKIKMGILKSEMLTFVGISLYEMLVLVLLDCV